jgi:hypothetical protein
MKHAALIVFIVIAALASCSKGRKADATQKADGEKGGPVVKAKNSAARPLIVRAAVFTPAAPTVLDDLAVGAELAAAEAADVEYSYQWFVDGREIADASGNRLDKSRFKKGSWIYCRIQAVSGSRRSAWFKSDLIRVLNSLPTLQMEPVGNFSVPGDIQYQAAASDPDGDTLTFEVVSPLEQGIVIDSTTGALSWHLTEELVKKLGESIEIKIAVSDGEGEKVTGTITLGLTSTRQTK